MSSSASETFRLEAFADAVFAIAITLLVIEIHLPPHEEVLRLGGVGAALASLWPSYVGYAISFPCATVVKIIGVQLLLR